MAFSTSRFFSTRSRPSTVSARTQPAGNISQDGRTPTRTYYTPGQCLFNTPDRTPQAEYPPGLVIDEEDSLDLRSFQSHVNSQQSESFTQLFVMVQEQQSLLLKLLSGQEELKEQQDEMKIWQEQTEIEQQVDLTSDSISTSDSSSGKDRKKGFPRSLQFSSGNLVMHMLSQ